MADDQKNNQNRFDAKPIQNVMKQLDSFFNESRTRFRSLVDDREFRVSTNETDRGYEIRAQLPGYSRDQIELQAIGNQLHISARNETLSLDQNHSRNALKRVITLPFLISEKDIKASHRNGLLTVLIPKKKINPHQIDIE